MGKKIITEVKYKQALINARAIQNDKSLNSEKTDKFITDVAPFLTKKGNLRKGLSKKKQEEFNKLVSDYKASGTPSKSKLKKQKKKALETGKERGTFANASEQNRLIDVFSQPAVKGLLNKGMDSQQIVSLTKTFKKVTANEFNKVAQHLLNKMEADTPKEASDFLSQDDAYMELETYLYDQFGYDDEDVPFD